MFLGNDISKLRSDTKLLYDDFQETKNNKSAEDLISIVNKALAYRNKVNDLNIDSKTFSEANSKDYEEISRQLKCLHEDSVKIIAEKAPAVLFSYIDKFLQGLEATDVLALAKILVDRNTEALASNINKFREAGLEAKDVLALAKILAEKDPFALADNIDKFIKVGLSDRRLGLSLCLAYSPFEIYDYKRFGIDELEDAFEYSQFLRGALSHEKVLSDEDWHSEQSKKTQFNFHELFVKPLNSALNNNKKAIVKAGKAIVKTEKNLKTLKILITFQKS